MVQEGCALSDVRGRRRVILELMDDPPRYQLHLGLDATDEAAEELAYWKWEYEKARKRTRENPGNKEAIHDERMAFLRLGFCELTRRLTTRRT